MKRLLLICILVVFPQAVFAESFGKDAIYVVNMQRVVTESKRGKAARDNFEADAKKQRELLKAQETEVKKLQDSIKTQAAVLSKSALEGKVNELKGKLAALRKSAEEKTSELARRNNALVEKIANETGEVIKELCKERGYKFVIERGQAFVVYSDEGLDLTDEIIELLDKRR